MNKKHVYTCLGGPLARRSYSFPHEVHDQHGILFIHDHPPLSIDGALYELNSAPQQCIETLPEYRIAASECYGDMLNQTATYYVIPAEVSPHNEALYLARELVRYQNTIVELYQNKTQAAPGFVEYTAQKHGIKIPYTQVQRVP